MSRDRGVLRTRGTDGVLTRVLRVQQSCVSFSCVWVLGTVRDGTGTKGTFVTHGRLVILQRKISDLGPRKEPPVATPPVETVMVVTSGLTRGLGGDCHIGGYHRVCGGG